MESNDRDDSKKRLDLIDSFIKNTLGFSSPKTIEDKKKSEFVQKNSFSGQKPNGNNNNVSEFNRGLNKRNKFRGNFHKRNELKYSSPFVRVNKAQNIYNGVQKDPKGKLRIIPIGGLDEVGKNTMIFEYEDSIILVDLGFQFPEADMLGVDYVIPDIQYLKDKTKKIKGIVITHGHLDHIGAIPYLLPKLGFPPIYAGRLAKGLIEKQLEEHGLLQQASIHSFSLNDTLIFGKMKVGFFGITHSIPDCCGVFIETPAGNVVHTGDFKIDLSPAAGQNPIEFEKISSFGRKGVAVLMADSTNATKPGMSISEKKISETLDKIIASEKGRIIVASFSSQIGRIQQVLDAAKKHHRKVFLSGRSLINNIALAKSLGFLSVPEGLIQDIRKAKKTVPENTLILTTGSQGEPVAALSRMAQKEHAHIKITEGDTVVLSSSPIPGNETAVFRVINNLNKLGAKIINNQIMDVHASGHAFQEDLKLMFSLIKPKYYAPIHGEFFMRKANGDLMINEMRLKKENMLMAENGYVIELQNDEAKIKKENIQTSYILVDGLGGGDIGSKVMSERQALSENGTVVVVMRIDKNNKNLISDPLIETRGFIYREESQEIINNIVKKAKDACSNHVKNNPKCALEELKIRIRQSVDQYVVSRIDRKPLIIPIIIME